MIVKEGGVPKRTLLLLLSILFACFFIPGFFIANDPSIGLNESSQIALSFALKNHLIFGQDFIFALGPSGFLVNRLPAGIPLYFFLFVDFIVFINVVYIIYTILSKSLLSISIRVLLVSLLVIQGDVSTLLIIILVFLIFEYLEIKKRFLVIDIVIISSLSFLTKLDVGLISFGLVILFLIYLNAYQLMTRKESLLIVLSIVGLTILISYASNTSIFPNVNSGFSIIKGYGDGMYVERTNPESLIDFVLGCACLLLLIGPFFFFIKEILANKHDLMLYSFILLFGFSLFISSLLRADNIQFFDFIVPLSGILIVFINAQKKNLIYYSMLPIMLLTLIFTLRSGIIANRIVNLLRSDIAISDYLNASKFLVNSASLANPSLEGQKVTTYDFDAISNRTIDLPSNISMLVSENLKDTLTPVYTKRLAYADDSDTRNASFIEQKGPNLILAAPYANVEEYFLYDDTKTKLEILKHYAIKETKVEGDYILLERLKQPVSVKITPVSDEEFELNQPITLKPSDEIQVAYPNIEYTWIGNLSKFLFGAPKLSVTLTLNDESTRTFRYKKSLGNSGVIVNKFVEPNSKEDYEFFIDHFGRLNSNIKFIQFSSESGWAFKKYFNLRIEEVKFLHEHRKIRTKFSPIDISNMSYNNGSDIRANIESQKSDLAKVNFSGWMFANDSVMEGEEPYLLLEAKDHRLIFPITRFIRSDVKEVFGKNATDSPGFQTLVYLDYLRNAEYKVGFVFLKNNQITRRALLTNNVINNTKTFYDSLTHYTEVPDSKAGELKYSLEYTESDDKSLRVGGWAYIEGKKDPKPDSIFIILKNKGEGFFIGNLQAVIRQDVSEFYKNNALDNTGFRGIFTTQGLPMGLYTVGLLIKRTGESGIYQFIKEVAINYPSEFTAVKFEENLNLGKKGEDLNFRIDSLGEKDGLFKLSGWAFIENQSAKNSEIYILLKSEEGIILSTPTKLVSRPDVTAYFNSKFDLADSGFEVSLSKRSLKRGEYEIGFYIKSAGNKGVACFSGEYIEK